MNETGYKVKVEIIFSLQLNTTLEHVKNGKSKIACYSCANGIVTLLNVIDYAYTFTFSCGGNNSNSVIIVLLFGTYIFS